MPLIMIRQLKSRGAYVDHKEFRRVMYEGMRTEIGPVLIKAHLEQIAHWRKNKPKFSPRIYMSKERVIVRTVLSGTGATLWQAHDEGVPGRTIRPTGRFSRTGGGRALRMPTVRVWGSRKRASYHRAYAQWPGIRARRYSQRIRDQQAPEVRRRLGSILRRAVDAARKDSST